MTGSGSGQRVEQAARGLELGEALLAARVGLASSPHCSICQSSSTCAAAQASSSVSRPRAWASAISAEPVSVVMT